MESSADMSLAAEHQSYDPQFTADISSRMRVPDHLGMTDERRKLKLIVVEVKAFRAPI